MSDKGWHVVQVLGMGMMGTVLLCVGAVTVNPLLMTFGGTMIGMAGGNAMPQNLLNGRQSPNGGK